MNRPLILLACLILTTGQVNAQAVSTPVHHYEYAYFLPRDGKSITWAPSGESQVIHGSYAEACERLIPKPVGRCFIQLDFLNAIGQQGWRPLESPLNRSDFMYFIREVR